MSLLFSTVTVTPRQGAAVTILESGHPDEYDLRELLRGDTRYAPVRKAEYREEMDTLIQLSNLRSLDREIVDRLIRTIRIFEDRRIEIVWNFSSPYAALIEGYERKDNHEGNK